MLAIRLDDPRIAVLEKAGLPLTMVGRTESPRDYPYVDVDADLAVRRTIEHLVAGGRRSVAFVAGAASDPAAGYGIAARLHASIEQLAAESGLGLVSVFRGSDAAAAAESARRAIAAHPDIDAIVAFGDVALGGPRRRRERGPCGSRGHRRGRSAVHRYVAELVRPRATTVAARPIDLGRCAAAAMIRHLADGSVEQGLLEPELAARESS